MIAAYSLFRSFNNEKSLLSPALLMLEVWDLKTTYGKLYYLHILIESDFIFDLSFKVGVLRPVQQPGSYWDRSSELPLVGLEPTEVTAIRCQTC